MPTAFISGANRGLGLELTRQYLEQGWSVISASRGSSSELDELSQQPGLETYRLDLTLEDSGKILAWDGSELPW